MGLTIPGIDSHGIWLLETQRVGPEEGNKEAGGHNRSPRATSRQNYIIFFFTNVPAEAQKVSPACPDAPPILLPPSAVLDDLCLSWWPFINLKECSFLYVTILFQPPGQNHVLPSLISQMNSVVCFHFSRLPSGPCISQPLRHPPPSDVNPFWTDHTCFTFLSFNKIWYKPFTLIFHNCSYNSISSVFICRGPHKMWKNRDKERNDFP